MASSILGRRVLPAAALAVTTHLSFSGHFSSLFDGEETVAPTRTSCEKGAEKIHNGVGKTNFRMNNNSFLFEETGGRETILRKRMTFIGRFSLKSETADNPSIPTFFLALSGLKRTQGKQYESSSILSAASTKNIFTVEDFETAWFEKDMPSRHPRFHSTVSAHDDRYFEEVHHIHPYDEEYPRIKAELDRHASETMHFSAYREDLRHRLEYMLTSPIQVSEKLWEVKISNGPLGTSGAISRAKVADIVSKLKTEENKRPNRNNHHLERRKTFGPGNLWSDAAHEADVKPMESVLLFRSHHALADGASIMAALSDLCDEAEEIRDNINDQLKKWKRRGRKCSDSFLRRILKRIVRLLKMSIWFTVGTVRAVIYQGYLQIETRKNPFDEVKEYAEENGGLVSGRSISWCDVAPLEESKHIAHMIGQANGAIITINDLFVSCVTAAIVRQLVEHNTLMLPASDRDHKSTPPHINVVIPIHLRGGVILPGESVGNRIGACVMRCPGEIKSDTTDGDEAFPTERLLGVNKALSHMKRTPAALLSHYMAKFCSDHLPESWSQSLFKGANANACVVVSNNRGFDKKVHIGGMSVESAHGFLPLPPGIPIGVIVQSYAGLVSLSVVAEKYAVPDPDKFLLWVIEEYERLREEAGKLAKK